MEKRKNKTIGWILLVILILLLIGLNYVKFFMNNNNPNIEETPVENSASEAIDNVLNEIVDNFNNNEQIEQYKEQNINIDATLNNHSLYISYEKDETTTYEFNYNNFDLTITILNEEENVEKFNQIYEILIYAVQQRMNNEENLNTYIKNFLDGTKEYEGLTKEIEDDNIIYTMNITKKIGDTETTEESNTLEEMTSNLDNSTNGNEENTNKDDNLTEGE